MVLPSTRRPLTAWMAVSASCLLLKLTNPKLRLSPVARSRTTLQLAISPYGAKSSWRLLSS